MAHQGRKSAEDALALLIACGSTVEAAAAKVGVTPRTAFRWLTLPSFQAKLAAIRAEMLQRATAMLTAAMSQAVKTLLDLQGKDTPASSRLGAAKAVLEIGNRLRLEGEVMARLEAAERALGLRAVVVTDDPPVAA